MPEKRHNLPLILSSMTIALYAILCYNKTMPDVGSLITIGTVILLLIFFRLLDRGSRSIDKARKYAERCKDDITAFMDEKGAIIRNYRIDLEVERKAAAELMRRIQSLTREELAHKVHALTQIDERIRQYDSSLEELVQMTGRVQENLNRIRDESAFVEGVGKRVSDIKEKVEHSMNEIVVISEQLETMEQRFEQENAEALEKAVEIVVASTRSTVMDFQVNAQTIERKVEEHREAVEKMERGRLEKLARDEERIERLLTEAVDRAGSRADKVEEAALTKLREQAQDRLNHIKANFEEKVKSVQDSIKMYNANWKKDVHELNAYARQYKNDWEKEIAELSRVITKQQEEWKVSSADTKEAIVTAAQEQLDQYRRAQEVQFRQLASFADDTTRLETELRRYMQETASRVNADFTRYSDEIRSSWENESGDFSNDLKTVQDELAEINQELAKIKERSFEHVSRKLKGFEDEFLANLSGRSAEMDSKLAAWQEDLERKLVKLTDDFDAKRKKAETHASEETKKVIAAQSEKIASDLERLKTDASALDKSMEEARRRNRELVTENNEGIASVRASMEEIRREITVQTKLFDRTDMLKAELDRHLEDMSSNIERVSQLKKEIARFESQLAEIKRLEDDINAKMTRFLSEKRRIEVMESDFNRLLQTSQSVEEKLTQVSSSDDILQAIQIQIRHLEDVIKETEEKYQRMERKNKTLQEINDGIDRNFRTLQEDEQVIARLDETIITLKNDLESIENSVKALSSDNEKARDAAEKLSTLDDSINLLERRIAEMNSAREGLARLATELQTIEKDAQTVLKLTRTTLDREEARRLGKTEDKGALPPRDRENIIKLKRSGWAVNEIAKTYGISISEVEMILELGLKDT